MSTAKREMAEAFRMQDTLLIRATPANRVHSSRAQMSRTFGCLLSPKPSYARYYYCLQFAANISASCALLKKKLKDGSEASEDDDGDKIPRGKAYKVYEPYVVEFPSYAAMEHEKFWDELLAFPWERGRVERSRRRYERKFFPKHGLDSMLLPGYREKYVEAVIQRDAAASRKSTYTSSNDSSPPRSSTGFPDDVVYKQLDYPTIAKALTPGAEGQESFRSQRSRPSSAWNKINANNEGLHFDTSPSIRTFKLPTSEAPSALADGESGIEEGTNMEDNMARTSERGVVLPTEEDLEFQTKKLDGHKDDIDIDNSSKPPVLQHGMDLPEMWDTPVGTVILIDKPKGWTSFTVCERIRKLVRVRKVGHAGTLDPMATGLLVVCVGRATKLADKYQALTKVYTGTFRLGEATSSCDADSQVNERKPWDHITDTQIEAVREDFMGEIMQIPPMFSAIKVSGERLYEKARRGEHLDLPARKVVVYEFLISRSEKDRQELEFFVRCSKGTYIRSLCADFARALKSCAHLTSLRREKIGGLSINDAWTMEDLEKTYTRLYKQSQPKNS
ncbi:hypothetical protein GOP47_0018903 [Adiantum capillus-veneris]|uniref:tRNA pseudouridine(55) synthase n=1 Tax=Adiantum capillus-veneris TaxID=13818 RepID=A0A9D4Z976_ADICA|nr:hypothetical protein GOP47_0018903 [Adiantum capillus-veneris]